MKALTRLFAALLFMLLAGCATVPYTERTQFMMISESDEEQIGKAAFKQVKKESELSTDPWVNSLIKDVGRRIAAVADRPGYDWEFVVIKDKTANAFALPGGKVAFHTGILHVCGDENGVAVVMGHEVAHALARHGAERLSQQRILAIGQVALMAALLGTNSAPGAQEAVMQAYGIGANVGLLLPYSRKHETEADTIGLILMAKAGYDPRESVAFWKRMAQKSGGASPPELLSTHPGGIKRIEDLEAMMPTAMEYYNEAIAANPGLKRPARKIPL